MVIRRTRDQQFIIKCMMDDKVWDAMTDDFSPPKDLYFPNVNDPVIWLRAEDCGVFMLHPHNHITYEVHTILPFAGSRALECARAGSEWMFNNTECERIITNVPSFNRAALIFAKKAGMTVIGVNEKSFRKNGVLYDQTLLGLSKEAVCQQQ